MSEPGDHLSIVPVSFHYKGKLICTVHSFVYPQYVVGHTLQLELLPTRRESTRRPAQKFRTAIFKIEKVHEIVQEVRPDEFVFRIEVLLGEVDGSGDEIDGDNGETSIPRRLLKPE